ncbi:16S rRNA (cytosine(967)-C(5))-methyltransferase RsmB [Peribacillus cavernae]|uniref:16S rRNA (cytosine(967)-C(5))-methyltransferase n=1 Tax=Peribacillus cavernae TaxID=1674310 RepID=A0A3S0U575_9BACI|nr:16S rRNA (cytosine(967)-C(5))-methyltransferase RsmB [Peribacillus cavernae]MDQ0217128.1 16S rRNA (cytosine967-C5)-methyltransferase [Peribacillus cavernae]RUQ30395.1 16S rRNA (cytosine(967)-C(5))-methyltransferase RsmB [Peribacillus cavernae]
MKQNKKTVREIALDVLESVEKNQSYSNLLLNAMIQKHQLKGSDSGLLTEITYGTIQRKMTLDYYLQPYIKNQKKTLPWVVNLLRLSLYQMVFLDKVPDHAILFEAVEIAKKRGHKGISSMVNGVLRNIQRKGVPSLDAIEDEVERLSIGTSHPLWLVERWIAQFGFEKTKQMCETNLTAPSQTARVNLRKISRDQLVGALTEEGYQVEKSMVVPEAIHCFRGNLAHSESYQLGFLTIQDESSMLVAHAIAASGNDMVLDCCAAPGGKTTHIAEGLTTGQVTALDLHEHKVKLIKEQAERLGLRNIKTHVSDSRKVQEIFHKEGFDRILIDAPCSGLGVMRRKPDVKYTKSEEDIIRLSSIQEQLLDAAAPLLKKGETLIYSTCTVDKQENDRVAASFLAKHLDFEPDASLGSRMPDEVKPFVQENAIQVLPQYFGSDGFFIASFRKKVQ